jgi:hypothetical protein
MILPVFCCRIILKWSQIIPYVKTNLLLIFFYNLLCHLFSAGGSRGWIQILDPQGSRVNGSTDSAAANSFQRL